MRLRRDLYALARLMGDVQAVQSGHITRRLKNRVLGRALGKLGVWRWLWS